MNKIETIDELITKAADYSHLIGYYEEGLDSIANKLKGKRLTQDQKDDICHGTDLELHGLELKNYNG